MVSSPSCSKLSELKVERATLVDLDWALANVDGKLSSWTPTPESKAGNDYVRALSTQRDDTTK